MISALQKWRQEGQFKVISIWYSVSKTKTWRKPTVFSSLIVSAVPLSSVLTFFFAWALSCWTLHVISSFSGYTNRLNRCLLRMFWKNAHLFPNCLLTLDGWSITSYPTPHPTRKRTLLPLIIRHPLDLVQAWTNPHFLSLLSEAPQNPPHLQHQMEPR